MLAIEKNLFNNELFKRLEVLKPKFFDESDRVKKARFKEQIESLIHEITNGRETFDFEIYFSEVFHAHGGFAVVIANPPYVGQKGNKELFQEIATTSFGAKFHQRRMDLFYYFFHLALNISADGGQSAFITTNYYVTATYADKLRADLHARASMKKLVNFNELRIFESALADTSNLWPLPTGWDWTSPDQLSQVDTNAICAGPFGTIFKAKDFRPVGVPIIFLRHVAPGRYLRHKPGFMDETKWKELFEPYSVFGGELLVTKLGEPPGVCAIYPEGIGPAMVTPDVIKMSVNSTSILPKLMMHYLNSEIARRFATGVAFGTTRLRVTLPIFREMPVPLPPLAEQEQIVAEVERRLSVIDELETTVEANLTRADRLRQSVLKDAFSGNLISQGDYKKDNTAQF